MHQSNCVKQYSSIQNCRYVKGQKHKSKQKLFMGHIGDRLERSHCDF